MSKTKIMFSLQHNDHLIWTAHREIDSSLARLMTQADLQELAIEAEDALRRVLTKSPETPSEETRNLIEKKRKR